MCKFKKFFLFLCLLMTTAGCGPRSLDDFQEEGEGVIRSLIQELKAIHTRDELIAAQGRLQRQFDRLVSIMIAAEEFSLSHAEQGKGEVPANHDLSDQLRVELNRLYRLEGGRQIIEKCQEKALYRLDAFQRRHAKGQD
jgi:hypothetical protein